MAKYTKTTAQPVTKKVFVKFLLFYWPHIVFTIFLANFVLVKRVQLSYFAQSCLTTDQVHADTNRCLYIYAAKVYEKGTIARPHKGNACGTDVTSLIPQSHIADVVYYLDPNFIGSICQDTPTPTATPIPTQAPQATATPVPPTAIPNTPVQQVPVFPSSTSNPQSTQNPTPTKKNNTIPSSTKLNTPTPTRKPTITPIKNPLAGVSNQQGSGFGKFVPGSPARSSQSTNEEPVLIQLARTASNTTGVSLPYTAKRWQSVVFWSELAVGVSFVVLLISLVVTAVKALFKK
jgi:hypothetical protein